MFIFKLLLLISISTFLSPVYAGSNFNITDSSQTELKTIRDPWLGTDKAVHFVGSMIATVGSGVFLQGTKQYSRKHAIYVGLGFNFTLGLGKELIDSRQPHNHFSYKDLAANIVGSIVGVLLLIQE